LRKAALHFCTLMGILCLPLSTNAAGGEDAAVPVAPKDAVTKDVVRFKGLTAYPKKRVIEMAGKFCLERDIVEFLAVTKGGRDYESMLVVDGRPSDLKVALELIGLKPSPVKVHEHMLTGVEDASLQSGGVEITLRWQDKNGKRTAPPETFLIRRDNPKVPPPKSAWVFTGSRVQELPELGKVFAGDYHKLAIGLWYEPTAVINYSVPSRNPYWDDDAGYEIDTNQIPPLHTKVTLVIAPWGAKPKKGPEKGDR